MEGQFRVLLNDLSYYQTCLGLQIINPCFKKTPHKETHTFSAHPPANYSTTQQSLSAYRLGAFLESPPSTVIASGQTSRSIESAHRTRVLSELEGLQDRLPK